MRSLLAGAFAAQHRQRRIRFSRKPARHVLAARGLERGGRALRERHHIYMVGDSRMNLAGIMPHNVEYVAESIASVLSA
jgi:aspartate/tyrosine/aromatic aminotransferase